MGVFSWLGGIFDSDGAVGGIDSFVNSSSEFDDFSSPSVNIDGSPMMGGVDIHGHPFGVTNDMFASSSIGCDDLFSNDDMGSSCFTDPFD